MQRVALRLGSPGRFSVRVEGGQLPVGCLAGPRQGAGQWSASLLGGPSRRSPRAVWTWSLAQLLYRIQTITGSVNYRTHAGLQGASLGLPARVPGFASIPGVFSPSFNSTIPDSVPGFTNPNVICVAILVFSSPGQPGRGPWDEPRTVLYGIRDVMGSTGWPNVRRLGQTRAGDTDLVQ